MFKKWHGGLDEKFSIENVFSYSLSFIQYVVVKKPTRQMAPFKLVKVECNNSNIFPCKALHTSYEPLYLLACIQRIAAEYQKTDRGYKKNS